MTVSLNIRGRNIPVVFSLHAIRIVNEKALTNLLQKNAVAATDELITAIKAKYYSLFNTGFLVSDNSVAVEIWGHVYVGRFAAWLKGFPSLSLLKNVSDKLIYHCQMIDIGERGHDHNRIVWNWLAPFKKAFAALLP